MKRYWLLGVVLFASALSGCCWRPWWCQQQCGGYYNQPAYPPQPTYQYQQPMYAPTASNPCTCY